jgi:DNA-binding transcriptional MerR regulator
MAEQPAMTIGDLARRTGVAVKVLRRQQDLGLIYTRGRSPAGYRLFDENALWCVRIVRGLRDLGLTEAEIQRLAETCDNNPGLVGPPLAVLLRRSRDRIDAAHARLCRPPHSRRSTAPWPRRPDVDPTIPLGGSCAARQRGCWNSPESRRSLHIRGPAAAFRQSGFAHTHHHVIPPCSTHLSRRFDARDANRRTRRARWSFPRDPRGDT